MPARRSAISGSRNSIGREARRSFQIEGLDEIQKNLSRVLDNVSGKAAKQVYYEEGAVPLRDQARQNAPYDPGRTEGVHLRDAIFADYGPDKFPHSLVGVRYSPAGAPHAHFIEFGTSRNQAQPYFRPAITQTGAAIGSGIKSGLLNVIERAVR